jgi:hypothetical protein
MSEKQLISRQIPADVNLLHVPYIDIEHRLSALEVLHQNTFGGDSLAEQQFRSLPRRKRLSRMHDALCKDVVRTEAKYASVSHYAGSLTTNAVQEMELAHGKVANLLSLERALGIADFIRANDKEARDFVGLPIGGVIGKDAGYRLLGHIARFGALVGGSEEPIDLDYDDIFDHIKPSCGDELPIITLGSVQITASGYKSTTDFSGTLNDALVLHMSHDPELYQAI